MGNIKPLFHIAILLTIISVSARADSSDSLPSYQTRHYTLYTDLPRDAAREASVRMDKMFEEYQLRTRDFSHPAVRRMPFYLYSTREGYLAAGAPERTAGYFNGEKLVVDASRMDWRTWHTLQHEGFHQFAHAAIGGDLPTWVDEGLAEFFGEAIFTGDGFVSGIIPQWRLQRVRKTLSENKFASLQDMMLMSHQQWNGNLTMANYDEGWSMVHFLALGEYGRYQKAFGTFMVKLSKQQRWTDAWMSTFGNANGFEPRWREFWASQTDDPTAGLYHEANLAMLTSFLARAAAQGQRFDSMNTFLQSAASGQLKCSDDDWLPPSLLKAALATQARYASAGDVYTLDAKSSRMTCIESNGARVTASYAIRNGKVAAVSADIASK